MSATSTLEVTPNIEKIAQSAFRLVSSGQSGFKKDGTGEDGKPAIYLRHGKSMSVNPKSRLFLGKGNGFMPIQYVPGADTIYENDYYVDKEGALVCGSITEDEAKKKGYTKKLGLKSQGYNLKEEYARAMELDIKFENGILYLDKYADDPMLVKFMQENELNIQAPRAKENRNPHRLTMFMFEPMVAELDALKSKKVVDFDGNVEAMLLVKGLRTQRPDKSYSYNEIKMDALLAITEQGIGLAAGQVAQKFEILAQMAQRAGAAFYQVVTEQINETIATIQTAIELEVLAFSGAEAKMVKDGAKTSVYTVQKTAPSSTDMVEELAWYFIGNNIGQAGYSVLCTELEAAKLKKQQ